MRIDEMDFDQKLSILRKFLSERDEKLKSTNKNDEEKFDEKITDKDKFEKPKDKPTQKDKPIDEQDNNNVQENVEELNDIECVFQLVIQIDRVKLEYIKTIDKFNENVIDSHIVILKNHENKFVFPYIETSFIKYELEHIREWKNNKEKLTIDDDIVKVDMLFKKALIKDIKQILEKIFKTESYIIESIYIGKEYSQNKFLTYIQIKNPIEKCKAVKFRIGKTSLSGSKLRPYGVRIKDLIDMAVKQSININKKSDKQYNPFSTVLMLYLAEVTFREDIKD
jgi:hypothetical protein